MKRSQVTDSSNAPLQLETAFVDSENGEIHSSSANPVNFISIENAMDRLCMGVFQYRIILASGLCFAADAMEVLLLSFLSTVLQAELQLTPNQTALIASVVFAGSTIGSLVFGPLSDRIGRRPVFLAAACIISFFGIATALAPPLFPFLLVARFCVGIGVGGSTIPFDTLAEFLPTMKRGRNLLYIQYFWTAGTLLVPPVAYLSFGHQNSEASSSPPPSWRLFCFLCALPCIASAILGYYFVPESPRWLCTHGRTQEALAILKKAARVNGHRSRDSHADCTRTTSDFPYPDGLQIESTSVPKEEQHSLNFARLLNKKWRMLTLKLWGTWLSFAVGYLGTVLIISRVFSASNDKGGGEGSGHQLLQDGDMLDTQTARHYDFDYRAIFQSCAGEVLGLTMIVFTIDRFGRIPTQVVSYAGGGLSLFLLCYFADNDNSNFKSEQQEQAPTRYYMLVLLSFVARAFEMGAACVTWVSTAEILTTEIRTSGHSAANAIARLGSMMIPYLLVESTPLTTVGYFMLFVHIFAIMCSLQLPETKGVAMGAGMAKTT